MFGLLGLDSFSSSPGADKANSHHRPVIGLQDPEGNKDPSHGIREFLVGSGGKNFHRTFADPKPNSEERNADTFGVLKLTLHAKSYDWESVPEAGKTFTDSGSGDCH